jgi:hypothetical protein
MMECVVVRCGVRRGRNGGEPAGRRQPAGRRKWWLIMRPGARVACPHVMPAGRVRPRARRREREPPAHQHRRTLTARSAVSRRCPAEVGKPHVQRNDGRS